MESTDQVKLYFAIMSVSLALTLIAGGFLIATFRLGKSVLHKKRALLKLNVKHEKELLFNSIQTAEAEREQLARDLHDETGNIFTTLSLSINQLKNENNLPDETVAGSIKLIQSGIESIRRISHALLPFELELLGLEETLKSHFTSIASLSGISVLFKVDADLSQFNKRCRIAIYRICQELMSNCIKHAKANEVSIIITTGHNTVVMDYRDNGRGMGAENLGSGLGLKNIKDRVSFMNGSLNCIPCPGSGFNCSISIPLHKNTVYD